MRHLRHTACFLIAALSISGCYQSHDGAPIVPGPDAGRLDGGPRDDGGDLCGPLPCPPGSRCCVCGDSELCVSASAMCPVCVEPDCRADGDCRDGEYCRFEHGACVFAGSCEPRPRGCADDCPGVCGCDGVEYCNECEAASAGVSLLQDGPCGPPPGCFEDSECGRSGFCRFPPGTCGGVGECAPRPFECDGDCGSVCGCDGAIYCSECHAASEGVSVGPSGLCASGGFCLGSLDCGPDEYCRFDIVQCGGEDAFGECETRPACSGIEEPACGCDGALYEDGCRARSAGSDVGPASLCAAEARERACERLCELAPVCGGGPPPRECPDLCQLGVERCTPEQQLRLYGCSRLEGCRAVERCIQASGCDLGRG